MIDKRQRALLAIFDTATGQHRDWRQDAACARSGHPDAWYPTDRDHRHQWDYPRRVCVTECPVRQACLAYALALDEREGMWGGYTPAERQALKRRQEDVA